MRKRSVIEPRFAYRMMIWTLKIIDLFSTPGKRLEQFDIRPGHTVVDYGCGPGRYLEKASKLAGDKGKVYAADIHPMALEYSKRKIQELGSKNIEIFIIENNSSKIPDSCADRIYAIDMFHHVHDPEDFLKELHRIAKPSCKLFIEDGHQSKGTTIKKASRSRLWKVTGQKEKWVQFSPVDK